MQDDILSLLRSLKQRIEEITPFLDKAQVEVYGEKKESSLDLIMGELTMIVLMLTNADSNITPTELKLINDMRHVVYGYGIPELNSNDYLELCKKFLRAHPDNRMTIDHLPISIERLVAYDKIHGTEHANRAKNIFLQFAEALIKSDKDEHHIEQILFLNFKETLNNTAKNS
jgi:hypothetical protein